MIRAFVGPNGGGKTLAAIARCVVPALDQGREVVANMTIDHPLARRLESSREIPKLRDCVLVLDEITSCFPSRGYAGLPAELARVLNQLRKQNVETVWTAPNYARADVILREVTLLVTVCTGSVPDRYVRNADGKRVRGDDGKPIRVRDVALWPANRLFRWDTYEAAMFDDFTEHLKPDVRPLSRKLYWRPRHRDHLLYSTMEGVDLLDHVDEAGDCIECGGRKTRPTCKCSTRPAGSDARAKPASGPGR